MGSSVPLLNEYKQEFFWKRFPQTLLGGPKLRIGYEAPAYVYLNQILLLILPVLFGGSLMVAAAFTADTVGANIYAYIYGAIMFLVVLVTNLISAVDRHKKSKVAPVLGRRLLNLMADEDEHIFESCCGSETIEFVIPGKKFKVNIFLHALISAGVSGCGFLYLVPENLDNLFGEGLVATIVVCFFGWLVLMIGLYSLTVKPPPEWAQFRSTDAHENYTPLMRPFYIAVFCAVDIATRYGNSAK